MRTPGPRGGEGGEGAAGGVCGAVGGEGFHVDAGLDGDAAGGGHAVLGEGEAGESLAGGELKLGLHEVDAGDGFGDRVFHLETGIGFNEGEDVAVLGGIDEEFEGAEAPVADRAGEADAGVNDLVADGGVEIVGGSDLDDFLKSPLNAAFALTELGHLAAAVADDLHFDMAGVGDELFRVEAAVAEGGAGFRGTAFEGVVDFSGLGDGAGAASAAAGNGFEHHGGAGAEAVEEFVRVRFGDGAVGAGQDGHAGAEGGVAGGDFVAEEFELVDGGAHEGDVALSAAACQGGVLGEEAVAGVQGVATGVDGGGDDLIDVEVGGGAGPVQAHGGAGVCEMQGVGVVFGVDGDGGDVQVGGGAKNADGDFAPVGDEQAIHGHDSLPPCELNVDSRGEPSGKSVRRNPGAVCDDWPNVAGRARAR